MLRERVLTAIVLLALLVPAVLATSPLPFAALTLVLVAAAGWEWGRLCGFGPAASVVCGLALGAACFAVSRAQSDMGALPRGLWVGVTLVWALGGAVVLRSGPQEFAHLNAAARLVAGWLLLVAAWLALVAAKERGLPFLLSVFVLVWAADIAAYFGGRAFGRRKLAPAISPGKSWEGVWSGLAAVEALAALLVLLWPDRTHLFALLQSRAGWAGLVAACAALVALAVVGDLCESLAKRAAGAKDSSRLLPGHGGVLDRIDALLPVFPAALALARYL